MSRYIRSVFLLVIFLEVARPAFAENFIGKYFKNLYRTEKRGVANVLSGFAELPIALHEAHGEGATPVGYIDAAVRGAVWAMVRTASGLWDIPAGVIPGFQRGFPPDPETLFKI